MIFGREPAVWIGLIVSIAVGVVSTLTGQGFISDATSGQLNDGIAAISQLALLLAPLIAGLLIRPRVTPV